MRTEELTTLLLERLRDIDGCIADVSALIRSPPESSDELQRLRASLDQRREVALDGLKDFIELHRAHIDALASTRPVRVARELLSAMMAIRAIRLLPGARQDWCAEFYWDLYYIENRLAYATLRELDEETPERLHM